MRLSLADPDAALLPATFEAGLTVVRMIIDVIIRPLANNQAIFGAYGVLVNVGLATVDAILDLYDYYLHANFQNISTSINDASQNYRRAYDIRTARRVRGENRALEAVVTNNAGSGTSVIWTISSRLLLKAS